MTIAHSDRGLCGSSFPCSSCRSEAHTARLQPGLGQGPEESRWTSGPCRALLPVPPFPHAKTKWIPAAGAIQAQASPSPNREPWRPPHPSYGVVCAPPSGNRKMGPGLLPPSTKPPLRGCAFNLLWGIKDCSSMGVTQQHLAQPQELVPLDLATPPQAFFLNMSMHTCSRGHVDVLLRL